MRNFQIILSPENNGFALQNLQTMQTSDVIPIRQNGTTKATFPDGSSAILNIEGDDSSAVTISLADQGDILVCPSCGESLPALGILIAGDTYEVAHVVRIAKLSLRSGGLFGLNLSLLDLLLGFDPRASFDSQAPGASDPQTPEPADAQAPFSGVDGTTDEFLYGTEFAGNDHSDDDCDDEDDNEKDDTDVEAEVPAEAEIEASVTDLSTANSSDTQSGVTERTVVPGSETA